MRIVWNLPIFSFLKKVSGIQTLLASVMVRYLIFPDNDILDQLTSDPVATHPPELQGPAASP